MLYIGCHMSAARGFAAMGKDAVSINANTLQFFTRNPRGGRARAIDEEDIARFLKLSAEHGFGKLVAHAPYTVNPCSADARTREFARETMIDDLRRLEYLPGNFYNFHPGSHVGQGMEKGIEIIAGLLNDILTPQQSTVVLLETMSGKGSEVGGRFEDLAAILERVELAEKMGVCLDTCHVNDAGYDVVSHLDDVLEKFDRVIGLSRLHAVHINDSKNILASHKDRHAKIGEGYIGTEAIVRVINHPQLRELPFILETPHDELSGYAREIAVLRERSSV